MVPKLEFKFGKDKIYKIKIIWDIVVYISVYREQLLKLYYPVFSKDYAEFEST